MTEGPLKVVMPMLTFVPTGMGGTETVAKAIVAELRSRPDVALSVLVSASAAGTFAGAEEVVVPRVRGGSSTLRRLRTLAQSSLPGRRARALLDSADVVQYPFTVPLPPPRGVPWVQSLYDVQHLDLPEMFSRGERAYRKLAYDRAATKADRIITSSEFSKTRIVERLGVDPALVDVAHLGVDADAFPYFGGAREPFVFYPATAWPHKNHARLIEAMKLVRAQRPELRLVLTGGRRPALGALPDWVEHRGYVPDDQLGSLYRAAACLVFPSLYEGFGLPPLEAMASGCPVAAAAAGSLPEICGDAVVLFDPEDVHAIAEGVLAAIERPSELIALGRVRSKAFSWSSSADAHARAYAAALMR